MEKYHDKKRKLVSFLRTGRQYVPVHKWSKPQLTELTPKKTMRYLKIKIYANKNDNFDKDIDIPLHHCRNSVFFWKKAWSYVMLNQNHQWSGITKLGNPTRSAVLSKLLYAITKMETGRQGKSSMAYHSLILK